MKILDPYQSPTRKPIPYHATTTLVPTTPTSYYNNQIVDNRIHEPYQNNIPNGQYPRDNNYNVIEPVQTFYAQHPFTTATTTLSPRDAYYVANGFVRANVFSVPKTNALPPRSVFNFKLFSSDSQICVGHE